MWLGRIIWNLVQGVAVIVGAMLILSHCSSDSPAPPKPSDNPMNNMKWTPE